MKHPNPLVPQGSFEAHARGKSQVRLAVFTILTIHVVVLGALLIHGAGCKREDKEASAAATNDLATTPPFSTASDPVSSPPTDPAPPATSGSTGLVSAPPAYTETSAPAPIPSPAPIPTPTPTPVPTPVPPADTGAASVEHVIVKGDTFAGLAQNYGVTVRAIQAANPGVDAARLRIGQKVQIPPKTTTSTRSNGSTSTEANGVYVVKSGDTLGRIATKNGTTVRAIQKLNNLVTTQIRVGQKLKMPPKATAATRATPSPAAPGGTPPSDFTVPPPIPPAPAQ